MHALNVVLWSVQWFLAVFFFAASVPKLTGRGLGQWVGFSSLPRAEVVLIGLAELLGAVGLVVPMVTGFWPWLTPLSAVGLTIIVLMAAGFHIRADERLNAVETVLWASIATAIAVGRWDLVSARYVVPSWLLIAALGVLVPAAIINVVILWRRPVVASSPARPVHAS